MHDNKWFINRIPNPTAEVRLFCFPYAGGGASIYFNWQKSLGDKFEVIAVQYPGRENRIKDPPFESIPSLVDALYPEISGFLDERCVFFGHSMGAKVVYELTKKLHLKGRQTPQHVIISGARGPDVEPRFVIYDQEREDFINSLRMYKGTPEEILQDENLLNYFLPLLYADFKADETYLDSEHLPFACPLDVLGGENDVITSFSELKAWEKYAAKGYRERIFPGGHFFLKEQYHSVIEHVRQICLE